MSKYFKNVTSYQNLKDQYKKLLKKNHPDNGGDLEAMKEINVEYDALFKIWKDRQEKETGETVQETAKSTRDKFYTEYGWEGSRYDSSLTLKEIAKIVRLYIKEKYPTYKFSVRTSYASMCQELHVSLKESPIAIYKQDDQLSYEDFKQIAKKLFRYDDEKMFDFLDSPKDEKIRIIKESESRCSNILNEITQEIIKDVDSFVKSYNYEDCDGMIDYFDVNFYYFGCCQDNGESVKIVPKTARIKNKENRPTEKAKEKGGKAIEKKGECTYKISKGEDTRDGSVLWIVRVVESLSREEYKAENAKMKELGAYYSRFLHGFLFREDPTELLKTA